MAENNGKPYGLQQDLDWTNVNFLSQVTLCQSKNTN